MSPEVVEIATCPTCGMEFNNADWLVEHLDGLDADNLSCARQDIEAIAARAQPDPFQRFLRGGSC